MRLYHIGFEEIRIPDVHYGRKNADFGQGFYLTDDKEFSYRWAKEKKGVDTILNIYELKLDGLTVRELKRDMNWTEYIYQNRTKIEDKYAEDVIIGPIANDIIYDVMGITTSGMIPRDIAMSLLLIGPEYKQIVLKTEKAVGNLKWISSEVLSKDTLEKYHSKMQVEEEAYQELFSSELERMLD